MWTRPALARANRTQSLAQRRRSITFTPVPLPREKRDLVEVDNESTEAASHLTLGEKEQALKEGLHLKRSIEGE